MKITFVNGIRKGETVSLQPPGVCIGRESDNDIQLLVAGISRYHAKISFDGIRWFIQDLGSTNGTKVNGKIIEEQTPLLAGDELILGDQTILFGDVPLDPHKTETVRNMGPITRDVPPSHAEEPSKTPAQEPEPIPPSMPKEPPKPIPISGLKPEKEKKGEEPVDGEATEKNIPSLKLMPKRPAQLFAKPPTTNVFGKKEESQKKDTEEKGKQENKSLRKRLIFPVLVVSLAIIVVSFFVKQNFMSQPEKPVETGKKTPPEFILHYERIKTEPDNVFRFEFLVENGKAEVVLDDLKYKRHFSKKIDGVKPSHLKALEDSIRETEFMKLKQEPVGALGSDRTDEKRSMTIGINNKFNSISVRNAYAQSSFEAIERAIERFTSDNGISTVSMNVEEMKKHAFDTFRKAEDLFANYQAKPENLREAINRYKLAMEYLEQFSPKPQEWDTSRKRLSEAQEIYAKIMKDYSFNLQYYNKLKQYDKASAEAQKAMQTVEPGSETYFKLQRYKLEFDKKRRK